MPYQNQWLQRHDPYLSLALARRAQALISGANLVVLPGYGHARAADTGGGVKGKFVDLGYEDHNYQSWHWWSDIYLTTPVPPPEKIRWVLPDWPKYPDRKHR